MVRLKAWAPAFAWAALIFGLSSIPGTRIPDVGFSFADKVAHLVVYAGLGALCFRGLRHGGGRLGPAAAVGVAVMLTLVFGISDEAHQMFVPNRSTEVLDLAADVVGGLAGALAARAAPGLFGATAGVGPRS